MITPMLVPAAIISSAFFMFWMMTSPDIVWDALMFRMRQNLADRFMCLGMWIYLAVFALTATHLAALIS
jgi:hypothetical protein